MVAAALKAINDGRVHCILIYGDSLTVHRANRQSFQRCGQLLLERSVQDATYDLPERKRSRWESGRCIANLPDITTEASWGAFLWSLHSTHQDMSPPDQKS